MENHSCPEKRELGAPTVTDSAKVIPPPEKGQTVRQSRWLALTDAQRAARQRVVDYMTAMATVSWTPDRDLFYDDFGKLTKQQVAEVGFTGTPYYANYRTRLFFRAGTIYHGLPYTHQFGNLEKMAHFIGSDGVLHIADVPDDFGTKTADLTRWNGWMGWDAYLGTDCSGSVASSWGQVSNVFFDSTGGEIPDGVRIFPVGGYTVGEATRASEIVRQNGAEVLYRAYAEALPGDALLYDGHTRLVAGEPFVVENPDGSIDAERSYLPVTDITRSLHDDTAPDGSVLKNTVWRVARKNTFAQLFTAKGGNIVLTCRALLTGTEAPGSVRICDLSLFGGTAYSVLGHRILWAEAEISGEGGTVWQNRLFPVGTNRESLRYHRVCRTELPLCEFSEAWSRSGVALRPEDTYRFRVTVTLSTGVQQTAQCDFRGKDAPPTDLPSQPPAAPNTVFSPEDFQRSPNAPKREKPEAPFG